MIPRPPAHSPAIGPGVVGPLASHPQEGAVATGAQKHTAIQPNDSCEPFVVDPRAAAHTADHPRKHTQSPIVTGTSVIGVKYAGGVLVACDTLGSYGSTKRYKSVQRIYQVNSCCVVAASGELSDFNYIKTLLDEMDAIDYCSDDGMFLSPSEVHAYLTRVLYNRRNKFDPLWNSVVVAGVEDGKPFLGMVNMIGIQYKDIHIGTGFGLHLGVPILRDRVPEDCSEETARAALLDALRVCYYRDKQCMNKFQIAKVDASSGVSISQPMALETNWDYDKFQDPTLFSIGAW